MARLKMDTGTPIVFLSFEFTGSLNVTNGPAPANPD
jgi:hypothetical protein